MSISEIFHLRQHIIPVDMSKVTRHEVELTGLELVLEENDGMFYATLRARKYPQNLGNVKTWEFRAQAEREFRRIVEAFGRGDYTLHLYNNGEIKVDVVYNSK